MNTAPQPIFDWPLFRRCTELKTFGQIILWWELRRIPFNLVVGLLGIMTCITVLGTVVPDNGEPLGGEPFLMMMGIFCYGIAANICYTGGWIVEIITKRCWREKAVRLGENSFALGFLFSAFLTLLPALLCQYFITLILFLNLK